MYGNGFFEVTPTIIKILFFVHVNVYECDEDISYFQLIEISF